ncbi:MAG: hemolysin family protein [Bdellovibrionaceae bacterium]|nr:hemolysin family protein [Pseudobdellovibrionaceae bacterium]
MALLITYITITLVASFICSMLEAMLLSISPAHIALVTKENPKLGNRLYKLKDQIDRPLAAILTINTLANTMGSIGVGVQVHNIYGDGFIAAASGAMTLAILFFSEIIPKTLGATYWKKLAPIGSTVIIFFMRITYPIVLLSEVIRDLFGGQEIKSVTREEMIVTAELGADEGEINHKESLVIRNLLMLDKVKVTDIMTPKSVIFALELDSTIGDVFKEHKTIHFSRIPVYKDTSDNIEGIVLRYKLMEAYSKDEDDYTLDKFMKPVHSVPDDISVAACLDQFIKRKEHLFIVIDEYGVTEGIVTLEDVVETLLGVEIVDELDSVEDMRKYARELWEARKKGRQALAKSRLNLQQA